MFGYSPVLRKVRPKLTRAATKVGPDLLRLYLDEAGSFPLLTKTDEAHLGRLVRAGQVARLELGAGGPGLTPRHNRELRQVVVAGDQASGEFINSNLRLVVSLARKYQWSTVPLLDLIQEGNLGLMHAVEKFDWSKGFKFSTYATWWVRQSIGRAIENTSRTIRVPVHVRDAIRRVRVVQAELETNGGRSPTLSELAEALQMTEVTVAELLGYDFDTLSLDAAIGEDGPTTLGDLVINPSSGSPFELTAQAMLGGHILEILGLVSDSERRVLCLRYGLDRGEPRTQGEVGRLLHLPAEHVRRIEHDAMAKLRRALRAAMPLTSSLDKARAGPVTTGRCSSSASLPAGG